MKLKHKFFRESGQALILIALAAIGLFGIAGLAIDGSAKFSDRRHAQNAADTAAVAGALALAREEGNGNGLGNKCPPPAGDVPSSACIEVLLAAKQRASDNQYNDNKTSNVVEVHVPPISGIYSNCSDVHFNCKDYVQVIITSHVNTYFARVVGISQTHNRVEAVASKVSSYTGSLFGGNAVVALNPTGCSLLAGGTTNTTVIGGGLFSNSDSSSCSFKQAGCSGEVKVKGPDGVSQGTISSVGTGMAVNTGCIDKIDASLQPGTVKQQPFPPQFTLPEPAACLTAGGSTTSGGVTTLTPGKFQNMPPQSAADTVILTPGIYCVEKQLKLTNTAQTLTLQGTFGSNPGVFIYIKPGGSQNPISLQGGDVKLWADSDPSGTYVNYLIYAAPNYATGSPTNCTINGSSGQQLRGTIYAPYCKIGINGSSVGGFQSQLIGYEVDLSGNSAVTINYNASQNATVTIPQQVGLNK